MQQLAHLKLRFWVCKEVYCFIYTYILLCFPLILHTDICANSAADFIIVINSKLLFIPLEAFLIFLFLYVIDFTATVF